MAKSRLRPNRKKYNSKTKKNWLFDKKSNILLIIFGVFLSIVAILTVVGVIMKYVRLMSK